MEAGFPGFKKAVRYAEIATPGSIERYTLKNGGAVAGPKQMLGQHMFKRLHTKSQWENLYNCGESTVMGTGTPTVTTPGISAANAVLKKYFPSNGEDIEKILKEVVKVMGYMDVLYGIDNPIFKNIRDLYLKYWQDKGKKAACYDKSWRRLHTYHIFRH